MHTNIVQLLMTDWCIKIFYSNKIQIRKMISVSTEWKIEIAILFSKNVNSSLIQIKIEMKHLTTHTLQNKVTYSAWICAVRGINYWFELKELQK